MQNLELGVRPSFVRTTTAHKPVVCREDALRIQEQGLRAEEKTAAFLPPGQNAAEPCRSSASANMQVSDRVTGGFPMKQGRDNGASKLSKEIPQLGIKYVGDAPREDTSASKRAGTKKEDKPASATPGAGVAHSPIPAYCTVAPVQQKRREVPYELAVSGVVPVQEDAVQLREEEHAFLALRQAVVEGGCQLLETKCLGTLSERGWTKQALVKAGFGNEETFLSIARHLGAVEWDLENSFGGDRVILTLGPNQRPSASWKPKAFDVTVSFSKGLACCPVLSSGLKHSTTSNFHC